MGTDDHKANKKRVEDLAVELFKEPDRVTIDEKRRSLLKRQRRELLAEDAEGVARRRMSNLAYTGQNPLRR